MMHKESPFPTPTSTHNLFIDIVPLWAACWPTSQPAIPRFIVSVPFAIPFRQKVCEAAPKKWDQISVRSFISEPQLIVSSDAALLAQRETTTSHFFSIAAVTVSFLPFYREDTQSV